MLKSKVNKLAAGGLVVVALASSVAVAGAKDSKSSHGKAKSSQVKPPRGPVSAKDRAAFEKQLAKDLAAKLNLDESKVLTALQKNRPPKPQGKPGDCPSAADKAKMDKQRDEHIKQLAQDLGVSSDKLKSALDDLRPAHPPVNGRPDDANSNQQSSDQTEQNNGSIS